MIRTILADGRLAKLASSAIKEHIDRMYGYPKYGLEEIESELSWRLRCMDYLGLSVRAIISDGEVDEGLRVRLASGYISLLEPYMRKELPKDVYECSGEPAFAVEAAAFLSGRGAFDWSDQRTIGHVIRFALTSGVAAKRAFLAGLIDRLNVDDGLLSFLSEKELHRNVISTVISIALGENRGSLFSVLGLGGMEERKRMLVYNLMPLLDADWRESSFAELPRLSALSDEDLSRLFVGLKMLITRSPNRVNAFRSLAEGLVERGVSLRLLLEGLADRSARGELFYSDEPKLKALCQVAEERGQVDGEFIDIVRGFLGERMETSTRLFLYKFVYRHTHDRNILQDALQWRAAGIRSWAERELANYERDSRSIPHVRGGASPPPPSCPASPAWRSPFIVMAAPPRPRRGPRTPRPSRTRRPRRA
jgi:hypothetical protein